MHPKITFNSIHNKKSSNVRLKRGCYFIYLQKMGRLFILESQNLNFKNNEITSRSFRVLNHKDFNLRKFVIF